jgi:hypothetical protein
MGDFGVVRPGLRVESVVGSSRIGKRDEDGRVGPKTRDERREKRPRESERKYVRG